MWGASPVNTFPVPPRLHQRYVTTEKPDSYIEACP